MRKLIAAFSLVVAGLFASQVAKADTCNGVTANLVSNCSFETGSFTGWSGTTTTSLYAGVDSFAPYSGNYEAYLGSLTATTTLSQQLSTTAGSLYSIEFALMNDTSASPGYSNSFQILFGGTSLFSESAALADGYTLYTYSAIASGAMTNLSFVSRNDGGFFNLDSISVAKAQTTAVTPEPSSLILLGTGALGLIGVARRRLKV